MPDKADTIINRYLIWAAVIAGILVVAMGLIVHLTTR